MMEIITIPHPTLRQKALPVTRVDKKLLTFLKNLGQTLTNTKNPRGVGLAANQVNKKIAVFSTLVATDLSKSPQLRLFINPTIIDRSEQTTIGLSASDKKPFEEGCLSMPKLYGAVPRSSWVKVTFDQVVGNELSTQTEVFENLAARVIQHELDHLRGVLFTDYSATTGLPVFKEINPDRWEEVDPKLLTLF